jgi:hypothetical protein
MTITGLLPYLGAMMPLMYSQHAILKAKHTAISAQIIHKYALLSLRKPYRLYIAVDCFIAFHVVKNPNPSVKLSLSQSSVAC